MKNLSLPMAVLAALLTSCTNDNMDQTDVLKNSSTEKQTSKTGQILNPENPANIYDIAGKIHNDIIDVYLSCNYSHSAPSLVAQRVDSIAALNSDFLNLSSNLPIDFSEIQAIIDSPQTQLEQEISDAPITTNAKNCLSDFMDSISVWESDEYDTIHQSIISYEYAVINNPQFSTEDKRIILTSSSIARHSLYYARKRKDKDWETSVGNRAGAVQGAVSNCSTAIKRSIVTGLLLHNLQN